MENVIEIEIPAKPVKDEVEFRSSLTKAETALVRNVISNEWSKANPIPAAYANKMWSQLTDDERVEYNAWQESAQKHMSADGRFPYSQYRGHWGSIDTTYGRGVEILALVEAAKAGLKASGQSTRVATSVISKMNDKMESAWCRAYLNYQRKIENLKAEYKAIDDPISDDFEFTTEVGSNFGQAKVDVSIRRAASSRCCLAHLSVLTDTSIDGDNDFAIVTKVTIERAESWVEAGHLAEVKEYASVTEAIEDAKAALLDYALKDIERVKVARAARKAALEQALLALVIEEVAA